MDRDLLTHYKLGVLYLLDNAENHLTVSQICDILLERLYTNYFHLRQALGELAESGFIQKEGPDSASYFSVTPQGREACRYLENDLDISIRREIVEQIRKHDLGTSKPTFSHAEYDRTVTGGSRVYLRQVIAGEKALEITMAVPGQEAARVICESWPLRSEKAYEMLMDLLLK